MTGALLVKYTGRDTDLSRRVLFSATLVLVGIHTVATIGHPKRNGIQKDPRRVGKLGDFDDVVIVRQAVLLPPVLLKTPIYASFCWRLVKGAYITSICATAGDRQPVLSVVKDPYVRIQVPSAFTLIIRALKVFDLFTTPQPNSGGRRHYWPRAIMLGGCVSSCNVELRVSADGLHAITRYGNLSDYDEWARLGGKGAESWAYKDFHRYFLKFKKFVPAAVWHDTMVTVKYWTKFEDYVIASGIVVITDIH
ncbi:hypothetical protein BGW80DRAFT_1256339 [Lactifluus volemus]|nr:hypothetical protein BGW80DRAFT_1256339 [Lactifluus volemus]